MTTGERISRARTLLEAIAGPRDQHLREYRASLATAHAAVAIAELLDQLVNLPKEES